LQVVLQILNGKPLVIQLQGMTVALMKGMITLRKSHFTLPSVPIGLMIPVSFPLEINNVGTASVAYKLQTRELTDDNCGVS